MSKELLDLVQRSQRFKPATKKPPKPTVELTALLKRMRTRRWKQETETELKAFIEQTKSEMAFIRHVGKCGNCLFELQMNIERYWGRGCPWFLDVHDEIGLPDEFLEFDDEYNPHLKGMPLVRDYQIGSYWTGPSDDTIRFIKDRLSWAEKKLKKDLGFAAKALTILEGWDFNLHTPQQEIDGVIEKVNRLEHSISPLFFF